MKICVAACLLVFLFQKCYAALQREQFNELFKNCVETHAPDIDPKNIPSPCPKETKAQIEDFSKCYIKGVGVHLFTDAAIPEFQILLGENPCDIDFNALVDEVRQESGCPNGWTYNKDNKHCYRFFNERKSYDDARKTCQTNATNSDLATPRTEAENEFVYELMKSASAGGLDFDVYIGLDDRETEGSFQWVKGERNVTWANWDDGQPDDYSNNQDCARQWNTHATKKWDDGGCSEAYKFVCEATTSCLLGDTGEWTISYGSSNYTLNCADFLRVYGNGTCFSEPLVQSRCCKSCNEVKKKIVKDFFPPVSGSGHTYYLSKTSPPNNDIGHAYWACDHIGAYIAEINNKEELGLIQKLIADEQVTFAGVFVEGSDKREEGTWKSWRTGQPLYLNWADSQPNNYTDEDCMVLWRDLQYGMGDLRCKGSPAPNNVSFVCEVENEEHAKQILPFYPQDQLD